MNITIQQESNSDHKIVFELIRAAFKEEKYSDQKEHFLVAHLRNSTAFIPALSLVAVVENKIVGHILLTKIKIKNQEDTVDSLALAPVSVLPSFQKKGIGSQLITYAHQRAKDLGFKSIILVGHKDYYPRFGYQPLGQYGITLPFELPPENCFGIELVENALKAIEGVVEYPKAFYL